uniref:Uncharacterized protein n=1 Tax=Globodera rostochiensis TaxID=31243 RepID=A0A914H9X6_GLORO
MAERQRFIIIRSNTFTVKADLHLNFFAASDSFLCPAICAFVDSVVILVVADPQLIGHRNEPKSIGFLSRWDADRRGEQYIRIWRYRFLQIFPLNDRTNRIYLPGDNDIGAQFSTLFSTRTEQIRSNLGNFHFPVLPHATAKIEQQLRRINVVLSAHDHSTALYMQWRQPPRFGHIAAASDISDVRWTVSMLEPPALPLVEFKSPTVSYRMGVPKMGYGLVVVTPFHSNGTASVQFSVLWLPSRFLQIGLFVCLVSLGVLSTLLSASGCCHRCKIVVRQMLAKQRRRRQ